LTKAVLRGLMLQWKKKRRRYHQRKRKVKAGKLEWLFSF